MSASTGFQVLGFTHSVELATGVTAGYGIALNLDSGGKGVLPAAGGSIIGISIDKQTAGQACGYQFLGVAEVLLAGSVDEDEFVKVDSAGKTVAVVAGDVAAGKAYGKALSAGASGNYIAVQLMINPTGYIAVTGVEAIATSVDLTSTTEISRITVATADHAGALADGKYVGQIKTIEVVADSGGFKFTLTPTTMAAGQPTSFVLFDKGFKMKLEWTATGWEVFSITPAGVETVAASGTANPCKLVHLVAVADTVNFLQGAGYCAGHRTIWNAASNSGTPVGTISATWRTLAGGAGTNANFNAASDAVAGEWDGAKWVPYFLNSATIS